MTAVRLARDVTLEECDWLEREMKAGETVYLYYGPTYGCIDSGVACTLKDQETPFFELPTNAIYKIGSGAERS